MNPFFGLRDLSFQDASDALARITGTGLYMSRGYYRDQLASGRIGRDDLKAAIERCGSRLDADTVERTLSTPAPQPRLGMAPVSEVLERVEGGLWSSFVAERISLHCAAHFDLGQALVAMPWRHLPLYPSWRKAAGIDRSPAMMGLRGFRRAVARLPAEPRGTIALAIERLGIPDAAVERYLHASLMSVGGWAAWTRYLRWQAELVGSRDDSIVDLLAIRLVWDMLLFEEKGSPALVARWQEMLAASMRPPSAKRQASAEIDRIMLGAMEIGFQRSVIAGLASVPDRPAARPAVQAAFCIDVRSEVFRRALETVAPGVQTIGFAGFFGIFIEHVPLGSAAARSHVPVIFNPAYRICERVKAGGQRGRAGAAAAAHRSVQGVEGLQALRRLLLLVRRIGRSHVRPQAGHRQLWLEPPGARSPQPGPRCGDHGAHRADPGGRPAWAVLRRAPDRALDRARGVGDPGGVIGSTMPSASCAPCP